MQNLICKLKNEISYLDSDTNVHSFYKYILIIFIIMSVQLLLKHDQ